MRARYIVFGLAALLVISVLAVACGPSAATPTVAPTKPAAAATAAATKPAAASPVATTAAAPTKPAAVASPTSAAAPTKPAASPAAASPAAGGTADIVAGKTVFDANCNACHPGGDKGVGPAIKGTPASTTTTVVRQGKGTMPAFTADKISDAQLANLSAYVAQLK